MSKDDLNYFCMMAAVGLLIGILIGLIGLSL